MNPNIKLDFRVYHVNLATNERHVYMVNGYSPSEPSYVKNPFTDSEADGVVMTIMSPMSDSDLRYDIIVFEDDHNTYFAVGKCEQNV